VLLVDQLFTNIDFKSDNIRPYLSRNRGDGGLTPGHLVFKEEFEKFSGSSFDKVLGKITGGRTHEKVNIGGPSIVSLITQHNWLIKKNVKYASMDVAERMKSADTWFHLFRKLLLFLKILG